MLHRSTMVTLDSFPKRYASNLRSVATCAGQPPLFSSDWTIDRACETGNVYTIPDNLRYHLLLQRFLVRVDKAMADRTRSPTGQPIERESDGSMGLLESDLEELERCLGSEAESETLDSSKEDRVDMSQTHTALRLPWSQCS
jgi:hypothetical protein